MNQQKILVFFGAHPDDESFGLGSTLARYAARGVKAYYVCSTGGEMGTVAPEFMQGFASVRELRAYEMECAAKVLGLAGVYYLGYRDSGMLGSEDNEHPEAMAMAPIEEIAGKVVRILRELKPDVVITHDSSGTYGHPDHIATSRGVVKAFEAAGDPAQHPEAGPPFVPKKLYFGVHPRRFMRTVIRLMPLFGQDPRHFGRNRDVDLTRMASVKFNVSAVVRLDKKSVETRIRAMACHASQSSGPGGRPWLFKAFEIMDRLRGPRDYFVRYYPPPTGKRKEKDLFEGI